MREISCSGALRDRLQRWRGEIDASETVVAMYVLGGDQPAHQRNAGASGNGISVRPAISANRSALGKVISSGTLPDTA